MPLSALGKHVRDEIEVSALTHDRDGMTRRRERRPPLVREGHGDRGDAAVDRPRGEWGRAGRLDGPVERCVESRPRISRAKSLERALRARIVSASLILGAEG